MRGTRHSFGLAGAILPRDIVAIILFVGFALVPVAQNVLNDPYLTVLATRFIAFALAALSLDLLLGVAGLISLGHAAFLGFGAYSVLILSLNGINDIFVHIVCAVLAAALFALVTGFVALRTRGVYFIMITLAFGKMAFFFFVSLSAFGGDDGMSVAERSTLFGRPLLEENTHFLYFALLVLIAFYVLTRIIVSSRFGRVLIGARESELRMSALGYQPFRYRLSAYVISGAMAAVAGVLLANNAQFVSPAYMDWHRSAELLIMVILGGIGNLSGALVGAIVTLALEDYLSGLSKHWPLFFGLLLIAVALFSNDGLSGLWKRLRGGER